MLSVIRCTALAGLLTGMLTAQWGPQWVPPGMSFDGHNAFWDFRTNPALQGLTTNARPIYAISAHKQPSDPAGQWTICMTVRALQGYGNPSRSGFVMAKWNPSSATPLVLVHDADAVNGDYVDYNLNLEPSGRYCVFDRFNLLPGNVLQHVGVFLATRANDQVPFGAPLQVTGLQGLQNWADPSLGYVHGQLKLFYGALVQDQNNQQVAGIVMDDLVDVTTAPAVAGNPVLVAQPLDRGGQPLWYCHSPYPIHGADGDVEGLFLAEGDSPSGVSNVYFAADLDPLTPHVETLTSSLWMTSGGLAGGTLLHSDTVDSQAPHVAEGAWLLGDVTHPGERADIRVTAYSEPGQPRACVSVYFSPFWLPHPITLPWANGQLAIPFLGRAGAGVVPDADQQIDFRFRVPSHPILRGCDLAIQGVAMHRSAQNGWVQTFTNSATVRVR